MADTALKDFYELRDLLAPFEDKLQRPGDKPLKDIGPETDPTSNRPAAVQRVCNLGLDNPGCFSGTDIYEDVFGECEDDEMYYDLRSWSDVKFSYWDFIEIDDVDGDLGKMDEWFYLLGDFSSSDAMVYIMKGKRAGQIANVDHGGIYAIDFSEYQTDAEIEALIEEGEFVAPMNMTLEQYFIGWIKCALAEGRAT